MTRLPDSGVRRPQLSVSMLWIVIALFTLFVNKENAIEVVGFTLSLAVAFGLHLAAEELVSKIQNAGPDSKSGRRLFLVCRSLLPCGVALLAMATCVFLIGIRFEGVDTDAAVRHSSAEALKPVIALALIRRIA